MYYIYFVLYLASCLRLHDDRLLSNSLRSHQSTIHHHCTVLAVECVVG